MSGLPSPQVANRGNLIDFVTNYHVYIDRIMLWVTFAAWAMSFLYATVNNTWFLALFIGGLFTAINWFAIRVVKHTHITPCVIAVVYMLFVSLHVHQLKGMIEAHFGYFVFLAALFTYLNWRPLVWAAGAAAVLHVVLHMMQNAGIEIYLFPDHMHSWTIVAMHAFYVVIETAVLIVLVRLVSRLLVVAQELVGVTETMIVNEQRIDLSVRAKVRNNAILDHLNWLLDGINSAIRSALGAQEQADQNLGALTTNTQQLVKMASQSSSAADVIQIAVDNMHQSFVSVAAQVQRAAVLVDDTVAAQREGKAAVKVSREGIVGLSSVLGDTAQAINSLSADCDAITSAVSEIQGIAEQTNLLALNAAIEAARAGEQGRGFAVVADEVRALAQRTQVSTKNIKTIVDRLVSGSTSSVQAMAQSRARVLENVSHSEAVEQMFERIASAIGELNRISQQIAAATEEQTQASESIAQQTSQLSILSSDTTHIVNQNRQMIGKLQLAFSDLQLALTKFH
ncbi:methyl-accepting chemotaxis protein [Cellvibrio sp. UBA7661]|uniref:methyl-accepting chemotaxis protein n=1 Tax=Cellvibrio sp. UBA7661 TaxID=1946311 RepID=UPI002F359C5C